ncbi:MAG: peptidase caspase catalytic subunit p20, partial [Mycobacterium sp.]|nr:peptidase caspase catalytic subunit p20 [Mycobacterium sp.]
GRYTRGNGGSGYNTAEVTATVAEVARLRVEFPAVSVGVVTPLAAQATRLQWALTAAGLSDDNVVSGTVHRFQGGERDIMVISAVGANGIAESTRNWLVNQTNLWNVAITRGKAHLIIVGDQSWWAAQRGMLAGIAVGGQEDGSGDSRPTPAADALHAAAMAAGLAVRRDVLLGGHRYDLVLAGPAGQLAVLVDDPLGDPDGRSLRTVLARLDLASRGCTVRRVPAWRCLAEPETVISELTAGCGGR